jgi:hypothetical protein
MRSTGQTGPNSTVPATPDCALVAVVFVVLAPGAGDGRMVVGEVGAGREPGGPPVAVVASGMVVAGRSWPPARVADAGLPHPTAKATVTITTPLGTRRGEIFMSPV